MLALDTTMLVAASAVACGRAAGKFSTPGIKAVVYISKTWEDYFR